MSDDTGAALIRGFLGEFKNSNTQRVYERILNEFRSFLEAQGIKPPYRLTEAQTREFVTRPNNKGENPSLPVKGLRKAVVHGLDQYARRNGLETRIPTSGISIRSYVPQGTYVTHTAFFTMLDKEPTREYNSRLMIIILAGEFGLKMRELEGVQDGDLQKQASDHNRVYEFNGRSIPVEQRVAELYDQQRQHVLTMGSEEFLVVNNRNNAMGTRGIRRALEKYEETSPGITPEALRNRYIIKMVEENFGLEYIAETLGLSQGHLSHKLAKLAGLVQQKEKRTLPVNLN